MKASVAIATTGLLGPRFQVSDKQLFREVKKTGKQRGTQKMGRWPEVILQELQDTL